MNTCNRATTSCHDETILVFDIGGTSLRGAVYDVQTGAVHSKTVLPTPNQRSLPGMSFDEILTQLLQAIQSLSNELLANSFVSAVSIAFPGPVDIEGKIIAAPGVWGKNPNGPIDLKEKLASLWPGVPVCIANDMTAAGYRYVKSGLESFCLVTVSTGIGNKVFINGKPQLGQTGTGGEIGHLKVMFDDKAPVCDCGEIGHLQAISSGRGVLNYVRGKALAQPDYYSESLLWRQCADPQELTNEDLCAAFRDGDDFACDAITHSARPLAGVLASLQMSLALDKFIIIGGFAFALGNKYLETLAGLAQDACWDSTLCWSEIIQFGECDDLSGLIGAGIMSSQCSYLRHF